MTFSYSGPSVSAAFVAGVFNDAWTLATNKSTDALSRTDAAIALATSPPIIASTPTVSITPPASPTVPVEMTSGEVDAIFNSTLANVVSLLTTNFTSFLSTHFPLGSYLSDAQTWIEEALTTGGSGINTTVEAQIWERERNRILKDAGRVQEELISTWATRRFPLPPGALAYQQAQANLAAAEKVGEGSREAAIQAFKAEIENVRLAVDKAIVLRVSAVNAAGDYIRALALGPQIGSQIATAELDARARMASAAADFYRSQITAADMTLRANIVNAENTVQVAVANQATQTRAMEQRVTTAVAAANSLATQAAAALNALHANSGINASESL